MFGEERWAPKSRITRYHTTACIACGRLICCITDLRLTTHMYKNTYCKRSLLEVATFFETHSFTVKSSLSFLKTYRLYFSEGTTKHQFSCIILYNFLNSGRKYLKNL